MTAASHAQAADAIIVEAEPMKYVKVCDMYGAGFFFIPGTEVCLNVNGYVRSTYRHSEEVLSTSLLTVASGDPITSFPTAGGFITKTGVIGTNPATLKANTSSWNVRGRLNFDVRNETEYGTLRSELRLQGGDSDASGDANVGLDQALISLAGFRLGYSDTYWKTNHNSGAGSPAINDGFYDDDQAIFFDYTATLMDGVSVTAGIQDSIGGAFGSSSPDFYVGMNASFGGLTLAATAIRDDYMDVNTGNSKDEWAYKGSAIASLGDAGWQVGGWYSKDDGHTQYVTGYLSNDVDEEWGLQFNGALSSNLSLYGLYSKAYGQADLMAYKVIDTEIELSQWSIGAIWAVVSDLEIQVEYTETETNVSTSTAQYWTSENEALNVRVTRSF